MPRPVEDRRRHVFATTWRRFVWPCHPRVKERRCTSLITRFGRQNDFRGSLREHSNVQPTLAMPPDACGTSAGLRALDRAAGISRRTTPKQTGGRGLLRPLAVCPASHSSRDTNHTDLRRAPPISAVRFPGWHDTQLKSFIQWSDYLGDFTEGPPPGLSYPGFPRMGRH